MTRELTTAEKRWITAANKVMKRMPDGLRLTCGYGSFGINIIDEAYTDEPHHPDADVGTIHLPRTLVILE